MDVCSSPPLRDEILTITNFTGHPALALRTGFVQVTQARNDWAPDPKIPVPTFTTPRRVPHGVSLIGRMFDEGTIGTVGIALEKASGVAGRVRRGSDPRPARLRPLKLASATRTRAVRQAVRAGYLAQASFTPSG